ncbi:magnesium-protoporphyrin IX monomethyl ester (oxidative) cyclase [Roseofilum sp. BLCC_M154]|uniref:Magnesium-protoporphyrin IX monomethyl ester [oxidative] cyclase n=1 Tax=Roseofilum acuticapitatum BLCC-M154 TaxID=3022444 RepID=A0ABT7AWU0_9CYAN|nr:magnesium-protoporphyrin IX monomethyl ester (oxidative) cyclase [Roseofilum acuticapitatum]MDJ1171378.1 magnesium-protoporphyrin IX monomethyl ester (oxidative) cyclase [Roseofilum acuticapitatum BLCC-M154]
MVKTLSQPTIEELKPGVKAPVKETLLTPRFYTTDFEAVASMDISSQEAELRAMVTEMKADYNRHHFVRNESFNQSWEHLDEKTRATFVDFLERSCTSEFSGFLLFKELSRKLKDRNPLLSEIFSLMARDEARHAGFLNKAMSDFKISLDLGYLTKNRTYTFFKPEWIIYAVYLSEKIGYWRYITVYRHLETHPEYQFYPLFQFFESWCQDENRHGDIFTALLRSQRSMWDSWTGRLWARFFLLTVFVTHSLTVDERSDFYEMIGLDAREYDQTVVCNTNTTAGRAFPVMLNVDHPEFFPRVYRCSDRNRSMAAINESKAPKIVKFFRKLPLMAGIGWDMLRLYLIKPIDAEAIRETVR